jgi:hypothetical protein
VNRRTAAALIRRSVGVVIPGPPMFYRPTQCSSKVTLDLY